jgi:SAM-dependent methyltransferase
VNPAEFANIAAAEQHFWWYRGMRRILFRLLDPLVAGRPIHRTLEAGCGTGYFAKLLGQRYDWRVYPVDLGWDGLQFGRQFNVQRLVQADIAALPFPDGSFQVVLSLDVMVHFPRGQEDRAMRELVRVLAPGGLLALRVSALDLLRSRHSQFAQEKQRFTRRRLIRLVERHSVRTLRASYLNSLLFPVALVKFRIWEPLLRKPPSSGVAPLPAWLDRLLYLPLAFEAFWLGNGLDFPLGQSLILIGEKNR